MQACAVPYNGPQHVAHLRSPAHPFLNQTGRHHYHPPIERQCSDMQASTVMHTHQLLKYKQVQTTQACRHQPPLLHAAAHTTLCSSAWPPRVLTTL